MPRVAMPTAKMMRASQNKFFLYDPVDELVVDVVNEFEEKKLRSVAKGMLELGTDEEKEKARSEIEAEEAASSELLALMQKTLEAHVKQVRLSNRLVSSPACLVGAEMDYSPRMEKFMSLGKTGGSKQRRILELNPKHTLFLKMRDRVGENAEDPLVAECAELLYGYALLTEGSDLADRSRFVDMVADLMVRVL